MPLTPDQIENIATKAATRAAERSVEAAAQKAAERCSMSRAEQDRMVAEAVKQTLVQLGVDTSNPLAMQRDFQHLRQWRESGEDLKRKGTASLVVIFLSGLVTLLILGVREWFEK